jgi:rhamnose transport system substrate-binding protein
MKKLVSIILCIMLVAAIGVGCSEQGTPATSDKPATEAPSAANESAQVSASDEAAGNGSVNLADMTFAIITKSAGNPYNEREASGFQEVIEGLGAKCIVKHPEEITAEAQITIINELVAQEVDAIAIAANDADALQTALTTAMNEGIMVVSLDSSTNAASRMVHVNQAGIKEVAQALMDAVLDLTGGSGDWAILSATSTATNQNAWIAAMAEIAKEDKYSGLNLVETAYGDDENQKSTDQTQALISNYPNLKCICAPTTVGVMAAAKVVQDQGLCDKIEVTGLGLPSEMKDYMGTGSDKSCPYMFLWNPIDVGSTAAYTLIALVQGEITGASGDSFTAGNGKEYKVVDAADGGTEIIIGPPFQFTPENIEEWAAIY